MRKTSYLSDQGHCGINDAVEETEIVTLQLNALDCNEDEGTEKVKAEEKMVIHQK